MDKKLTEGTTALDYKGTLKKLTKEYHDALDLINCLQAEKEKLQKNVLKYEDIFITLQAENERLNTYLDVIGYSTDKIKAEAYKEFAERLKEDAAYYSNSDGAEWFSVDVADIDNILKELVIKNDIGRYDSYTDTFVK